MLGSATMPKGADDLRGLIRLLSDPKATADLLDRLEARIAEANAVIERANVAGAIEGLRAERERLEDQARTMISDARAEAQKMLDHARAEAAKTIDEAAQHAMAVAEREGRAKTNEASLAAREEQLAAERSRLELERHELGELRKAAEVAREKYEEHYRELSRRFEGFTIEGAAPGG